MLPKVLLKRVIKHKMLRSVLLRIQIKLLIEQFQQPKQIQRIQQVLRNQLQHNQVKKILQNLLQHLIIPR